MNRDEGSRTSLDIDVLIEEDFTDLEDIKQRLFGALISRFELAGSKVFDLSFQPKPSDQTPGDRWGGYQLLLKMIELDKHQTLGGDLESNRRNAFVIGLDEVRRIAITALFSDDLLLEKLVLKGGNALRLIYRLK